MFKYKLLLPFNHIDAGMCLWTTNFHILTSSNVFYFSILLCLIPAILTVPSRQLSSIYCVCILIYCMFDPISGASSGDRPA